MLTKAEAKELLLDGGELHYVRNPLHGHLARVVHARNDERVDEYMNPHHARQLIQELSMAVLSNTRNHTNYRVNKEKKS